MRPGKLTPGMLTSHVFGNLGVRRPEVLVHAGLGEDSAVIDFGDEVCVLTTDPITGAVANAGWLGVQIVCNDLASNGARPLGILVTILASVAATEAEIAALMADVDRAARELGIEVLGGHSEITSTVTQTVLSLTGIGRARKDRYVTSAGARPGDSVLVTKSIGLEGTAILASDCADRLTAALGADLVARAQALAGRLSVVPEGLLAAANGATAMHDVTEGGVVGALSELAAASGVGVEVDAALLPILPETRAICDHFGADPLGLISSGALLITAPDGPALAERLRADGIPATVIGRVVAGPSVLHTPSGDEPLEPPDRDELWRILED